MSKNELLIFVYGALRRGQGLDWVMNAISRAHTVAWTTGEVSREEGASAVAHFSAHGEKFDGELHWCHPAAVRVLDAIEIPAGYRRVIIPVSTASGRVYEAVAYEYKGSMKDA